MFKITTILIFSVLVFSCASRREDDSKVAMDDNPSYFNHSPQVVEPLPEPRLIIEFELTDTLLNDNVRILHNNDNPIKVLSLDSDTLTFYECLSQIQYPEYWMHLGIQGNSFYGLEIDENGILQTINPLRTLDDNDLLMVEVEKNIKSIHFISQTFYSRNLLLRVKLILD